MTDPNQFAQLRQQLTRQAIKMRHVFHRARVAAAPDESGGTQKVQVVNFQGELVRDITSVQQFGFASSPLPGCDLYVVNANGETGAGYGIASNDTRYRPKNMQGGESQQHSAFGTRIYLKADGSIEVVATGPVAINAPKVTCTGDIEAQGDVKAGTISLKNHVHQNTMPQSGSFSGTPKP